MKLKLKNYNHDESLSIRSFIYKLLNGIFTQHSTLDEADNFWCGKNSWRSIKDITYICKYYYPESDYDMVKTVLQSFGSKLVGHYCGDINDWIVGHSNFFKTWKPCKNVKCDSFGYPIEYKSDEDGIMGLLKYKHSPYIAEADFLIQ